MCQEDRCQKIALLFEEAVEIEKPEERCVFLEQACGGDASLLQEVEQLLLAHQKAGDFLGAEPRWETPATGAPDQEKGTSLKPGDCLGPYRLSRLIGEGGSSTVYVAEQEKPVRRWVALKVIKAGMDTRQIIHRFKLERQTLAVMDHPGIAKVLDAGATPEGRPFFVMELVRGWQITEHCDKYRLTIPERLELFVEVCHAVLHAHQKGVIHRDIKPDNILISQHDGRPFPKIIDFGIAKVLHEWAPGANSATFGMAFLGTPAYMSPEQAQVTRIDLDTRTDIYSLGVLLHELLVGHPPFDHSTLMAAGLDGMRDIICHREPAGPSARFHQLPVAEQEAIARARRTSPEALRRLVTGDLDWIVLKAIEKEREQRYESAANLAQDLVRHLQHLPVSAAAPTLRYRFSKMIRRNRKAFVTTVAIGVLILASAIISGSLALRATSNAELARARQLAAMNAERKSHESLVAMHVSSAFAATDQGNYDRAVLWFANAARMAGPEQPEYALNTRRALSWLEETPIPVGMFQLPSSLSMLEFCPGSRYLLAIDRNGQCRGWDCAVRGPMDWVSKAGQVRAAAWHPEGGMLALAVTSKPVQIWNPADGKLLMEVPASANSTALGFTPEGRFLLFGSKTIRALDLRTRSTLTTTWEHPEPVIGFGYSSQPNHVISVSLDERARVIAVTDADGREWDGSGLPHRPYIRTDSCASKTKYREDFLDLPVLSLPALVARGEVMVTRTGPFEISLWDLHTTRLLHRFQDLCCSCRFVISRDGTLLAYGLQKSQVGVWDVTTGKSRGLFASHGACMLDVAFGPAGESLITAEANGTAKLWSVSKGEPVYSAMHHSAEVDKVAFRPDGQMMATAQGDGLVRVWAMPQSNPNRHIVTSTYGPKVVRFDPKRRYFVASKEPAWEAELRSTAVYDAQSGAPVGPALDLDGNLEDAALSGDCRLVALALNRSKEGAPSVLQFRETRSGRARGEVILPSPPASIAWDPRQERVVVICRSGELILATPNASPFITWAPGVASTYRRINPSVAFTPDGGTLISLTPAAELEVREPATGQLRHPPFRAGAEGFWHFAISDDSQHMASTTAEGEVRVWNLQTGKPSGNSFHHPAWVYRCRFSSDGNLLVTASHDGKVRIWSLSSGEQRGVPLVHPNEVYDATFTPDGRWVLTACRDGNIRVWEPESGQLAAPPSKVGDQAFTVEVTADGQFAAVGSLGEVIHVLSLALLRTQIRSDITELCLLAEVVSGSVVTKGSIRELTTAEWIERFQRLEQAPGTLTRTLWALGTSGINPARHGPFNRMATLAAAPAAQNVCPLCGVDQCPIAQPPDAVDAVR